MARPEKDRNVQMPPPYSRFKPAGVRNCELQQLLLNLDEYEALRLADYDGLDHCDAAERMQISRPTFTRLLARARRKLTEFLVEGKSLQIEGGAVHFARNLIRCLDCGHMFPAPFSEAELACPKCGSNKLDDLARGFGHGRCCRGHRNRGR